VLGAVSNEEANARLQSRLATTPFHLELWDPVTCDVAIRSSHQALRWREMGEEGAKPNLRNWPKGQGLKPRTGYWLITTGFRDDVPMESSLLKSSWKYVGLATFLCGDLDIIFVKPTEGEKKNVYCLLINEEGVKAVQQAATRIDLKKVDEAPSTDKDLRAFTKQIARAVKLCGVSAPFLRKALASGMLTEAASVQGSVQPAAPSIAAPPAAAPLIAAAPAAAPSPAAPLPAASSATAPSAAAPSAAAPSTCKPHAKRPRDEDDQDDDSDPSGGGESVGGKRGRSGADQSGATSVAEGGAASAERQASEEQR